MNWAVATKIFKENADEAFPSTVTSEFSVKLHKPTPFDKEIVVKATLTKLKGKVGFTEARMYSEDELTAEATGIFVAVKPGHPAYHRW